jgi:hypothetical protein
MSILEILTPILFWGFTRGFFKNPFFDQFLKYFKNLSTMSLQGIYNFVERNNP